MHPFQTVPYYLLLLLLLVLLDGAVAFNFTTFAPSPRSASPVGNGSAVVVFLNQSVYNESASVPAWERTDASGFILNPTLVVADDFSVPSSIATCDALAVDVGLLRAMGRSPSNARIPTRASLWLWADTDLVLGRSFAATVGNALASATFTTPSDPNSAAWASDDGGYTTVVDNFHIETLRFVWRNLSRAVRGGRTYWIGLAIALDRAYNTSDFSQNQPRWMVTTKSGSATLQSYRVVDAQAPLGAPMFRDVPALANWTAAETAESVVLLFQVAPSLGTVLRSTTRQLALAVAGLNCTSYTPAAVVTQPTVSGRYVNLTQLALFTAAASAPSPLPPPSRPPLFASPSSNGSPSMSMAPAPWAAPLASPITVPPLDSPSTLQSLPTSTSNSYSPPSSSPSAATGAVVGPPSSSSSSLDLPLIVASAIVATLLFVGFLMFIGRRYYRRHYAEQTYEEMMLSAANAPDTAAVALHEDGEDSSSSSSASATTATGPHPPEPNSLYRDAPPNLLAHNESDPPTVKEIKEAFDAKHMIPIPLEEEEDRSTTTGNNNSGDKATPKKRKNKKTSTPE